MIKINELYTKGYTNYLNSKKYKPIYLRLIAEYVDKIKVKKYKIIII